MKKIFVISYGGGHANLLVPVINIMKNNGDFKFCVVGVNLAAEIFRNEGIPCKTLSNYMTEEILRLGYDFALKNHNFNSKMSFADSIAYYGFSIRDLIDNIGEELAHKVVDIYDRRLFFPLRSMKEILDIEKPDCVLTTTMQRFEAAAIMAANEINIPSIKIEDLVGNINVPFPDKIQVDTLYELKYLVERGIPRKQIVLKSDLQLPEIVEYKNKIINIYNTIRPTVDCVMSQFVKNAMIARGYSEEKVVITGQPAFDRLQQYRNIDVKQQIIDLGLNPNKPIVSFMSQPIPAREKTIRAIIVGIKNMGEVQFIIKLHPNEDGEIQKLLLKEMGYNALIVRDIPTPIVTQISTLTSTISSTTGIEAACLDRDLVYFNFENDDDFVPYEKMKIGTRISKEDDVQKIIKGCLELTIDLSEIRTERKEYVSMVGKSAGKVKDTIIRCLS